MKTYEDGGPGGPARLDRDLEGLRPRLLRHLKAVARRRNWFWVEDEEGVVQEALARFAAHAADGRFERRDEAQLWGYVVRALFFVVMEQKDRARPTPARLDDAVAFDLDAWRGTLDDRLDRRRCLARLYDEVLRLQDSYRRVVELTLAGLPTGEAARATGTPPDRLAVTKFRALRALGKRLAEAGWTKDCAETFALEVHP